MISDAGGSQPGGMSARSRFSDAVRSESDFNQELGNMLERKQANAISDQMIAIQREV